MANIPSSLPARPADPWSSSSTDGHPTVSTGSSSFSPSARWGSTPSRLTRVAMAAPACPRATTPSTAWRSTSRTCSPSSRTCSATRRSGSATTGVRVSSGRLRQSTLTSALASAASPCRTGSWRAGSTCWSRCRTGTFTRRISTHLLNVRVGISVCGLLGSPDLDPHLTSFVSLCR